MKFIMRAGLLILGIPSIVLLFLPYTFGVSPWAAVSGKEWSRLALFGGPFFLSIAILIAQTRVLFKRPFSRGERATYRLLAFAALAAGLALLGLIFDAHAFSVEPILSSIIFIAYAAAVGMMILGSMKLNPEEATTVTLQAAWLPNAIWCAIGFRPWQIGAYLAAFSIVLYTVEITLSMFRNRRTPCLANARPKGGILSGGERPLPVSG